MTDAYAETDVWPNPPATHAPAPDRTESAPDASPVLGDVPTATDARQARYERGRDPIEERDATIAALRAERDAYRRQWHQEVENFERETVRAEGAEAEWEKWQDRYGNLRAAVEALLDSGRFDNDVVVAFGQALFAGAGPAASDDEDCDCTEWCSGESTCHPALASAAPAVPDGEGAWPYNSTASVMPDVERNVQVGDGTASPLVAPSATEAPQAPAEQDDPYDPDWETSPILRPAPSVRPATADDSDPDWTGASWQESER